MAEGGTNKARVAVVDDERLILESWQEALGNLYELQLFSDPRAAQRFFLQTDVDVALLDIRMPGLDGLTLLQDLRRAQPTAEAIVITGHGSIETAVQAIKLGAYDFLCKPVEDLDAALRRIAGAVEHKRLCQQNANLRSRLEAYDRSTELLGESPEILQIRSWTDQVAHAEAPVLICGESGTGKELVARALHALGPRRDKPFVAVNCAAVADQLIDSELFGHERGAFTGAVTSHKGLFEAADGGFLFLDEIGDVPLATQVRLLRALQEQEIRPVGSNKSRKVDVRVAAATHVDLERAMGEGRFRDDLYYRISTFRLNMPPLRSRRIDIPLLCQHMLLKYARRTDRPPVELSEEALAALCHYDWPGNVRELGNAVEYAATLARGGRIDVIHLPAHLLSRSSAQITAPAAPITRETGQIETYSQLRTQALQGFEQRYLSELVAQCGSNLSEASRRSGVDRSNLRRMLRRYNLLRTKD